MDKPTCETCRFWDKVLFEGSRSGACRRYPPQVVEADDLFPATKASEWCGEHAPREGEGGEGECA